MQNDSTIILSSLRRRWISSLKKLLKRRLTFSGAFHHSARQYLKQFARSELKRTSLLKYESGKLRWDVVVKDSVILTWQISIDFIRGTRPLVAYLLSLTSFFPPRNRKEPTYFGIATNIELLTFDIESDT
jgi:hypothetical protein